MISKLTSPFIGYVSAAAILIGFASGYKVASWRHNAALVSAVKKAEANKEKAEQNVRQASEQYEQERNQTDVVEAKLAREVRVIYRDLPPPNNSCAAPDSVVGLLKDGVSHANASASSESGK